MFTLHTQEYTKLKIQGKWSRDHRIASEIYDVRDYLEVVEELEEEFADDIRDYLQQQGVMGVEGLGPRMTFGITFSSRGS